MRTYDIFIPPSLTPALEQLPATVRDELLDRLADATGHQRRGLKSPGVHRGLHRATVGTRWMLYRIDHAHRAVFLISFGDRAAPPCSGEESCWENEGGHLSR